MNFEVLNINYRIPVSIEEILLIDNYEGEVLGYNDGLYKMLDKIPGISETDYDGWFGPYIYLTIDKNYNNDITKMNIEITIKDFIEKAKKELLKG